VAAAVAAERKAKDKPKPRAEEPTASCGCAAGSGAVKDRETICLQYKMDYGSYCMWYALHVGCGSPIGYYGSCSQNLPQNCMTGVNCITPTRQEGESAAKGRTHWDKKLAKDGFDAPPVPKPRPGVLTTEAYIEFSKNPSGGKILFAKILQVRMMPGKFEGQFDPPLADKPAFEDGNGFQIPALPAGATVFSVRNGEVITLKRDVGKSPRLVNVLVHSKDNVWLEYNILLDKNEPADDKEGPKRRREAPARK
jgi:hypothetical protein